MVIKNFAMGFDKMERKMVGLRDSMDEMKLEMKGMTSKFNAFFSIFQEPGTLDNSYTRDQKFKEAGPADVQSVLGNNVRMAEVDGGLKSHEDSSTHTDDRNHSTASGAHGHPQPPTWTVTREESRVGVPSTEQGDMLINTSDRFPRDLLSDIFSKAILSDGSTAIEIDGAGQRVNIKNLEPKHWSFFHRLAGVEFARRNVSLVYQGHVVFLAGLSKVEEESAFAYDFLPLTRDSIFPSHMRMQRNYGEVNHEDIDGVVSKVKVSEGMQCDELITTTRIQNSDYEDGIRNTGITLFDPSLVDFDITSLQIIRKTDLEELRELCTGTFGTIYHGKWRHSYVPIQLLHFFEQRIHGKGMNDPRDTFEFKDKTTKDSVWPFTIGNVIAFWKYIEPCEKNIHRVITAASIALFIVAIAMTAASLQVD